MAPTKEIAEWLERQPEPSVPFDPFFVPDDWSRLQYGRLLWKNATCRERLLKHWTDPRHPYRERFVTRYRPLVERLLESSSEDNETIDQQLREEGHSLRTIMREIPPVFGDFY
tara:strand:+ start:247 stop:585 length:339 start_codon:yes stop_codon:yes gene_type:complete